MCLILLTAHLERFFACLALRALRTMRFSQALITEYQEEMRSTYGVLVSEEEAQGQLGSLVRSMFPTVIAEQKTGSREQGAREHEVRPCTGSLPVMLGGDGGNEVGDSITPTSGQKENKYE